MKAGELSVSPEPAPAEREALEAAVLEPETEDGPDAWGRAALREATGRDPGE